MPKPSILQIFHGFIEGGSERQMIQITKLLHESGDYDVHVATLGIDGVLRSEMESLQLPIVEYPLTSFYDANMVRQTRRFVSYLKKHHIKIVHSHDFYSNIFATTGSVLAGIPARITSKRETTGVRTPVQTTTERYAFRLAHAVVANAGAVKEHLIRLGVSSEKIALIYNGIDLSRFNQNGQPGEALQRLGLAAIQGRPVITMVANFEYRIKDQPMLLRAAQRVLPEVPDAVFVFAGEGELREETQKLAEQLGLTESCFFIGRCASVPDLLAASDICVLSSQAEGFSNSILEYMAAGRAVVATDVGGASEAIVEGETGYLVKAGDDRAMAERIISLLKDPDRRCTMGLNGRRLVEQRFSCEARLAKTAALYQKFLN
ncbi:MAG TPA: glycosyltransferase family 4 protein [Pyrinomonadaceae bacterium]|nr:glycosyltransferase family 4 protein [Pyrinomonadaceae bacterium]